MADPVGQEYFRTVEVGERTFQEFSIERNIYHVPVDEVCVLLSGPADFSGRGEPAHARGRDLQQGL
jgi:hypothetical protein